MEEIEQVEPWGYQMIVNMKGAHNCKDEEKILAFNRDLCDNIEMIRHGEPQLTYFEDLEDKNGWTLVQLITTSSLVVHFCDNGKVFLDLFSCKQFNEEAVLGCIHYYFSPSDLEYDIIERTI